MRKYHLSTTVEFYTFNEIKKIAAKHFDGKVGTAIDWIMRSLNYKKFLAFMCKHHASQFNLYMDLRQILEEQKKETESFKENFINVEP